MGPSRIRPDATTVGDHGSKGHYAAPSRQSAIPAQSKLIFWLHWLATAWRIAATLNTERIFCGLWWSVGKLDLEHQEKWPKANALIRRNRLENRFYDLRASRIDDHVKFVYGSFPSRSFLQHPYQFEVA
jgi:hypothetical protein